MLRRQRIFLPLIKISKHVTKPREREEKRRGCCIYKNSRLRSYLLLFPTYLISYIPLNKSNSREEEKSKEEEENKGRTNPVPQPIIEV